MKRYGIRQQVAGLTFIPLLIMAIGMESFFLHGRFSDMNTDLLSHGKLIAHQLAASSEYGVFSNNQAFLQNIINGSLQQPDVRGVAILNSDSEMLVSSGEFSLPLKSKIVGKNLSLASIEKMDEAIILPQPTNSGIHSVWIYHAIVPAQIALEDGGAKTAIKPLGAVIVEISRLRHEGLKARMLWTTLLATTLFLAFAGYLVYLASRSITHPIRKLSEAVQEIGAGKLDTRIYLATRVHELATLAQGLNETTANLQQERAMLRHRIDEATQALREKKDDAERASKDKSHFLAVASHDLRQPLHALGLYVAELQRIVSGTGLQHLVGQVEQSIEDLSALLNALLDISKLDAGAVTTQIQTCDINAILVRVATDYQMPAQLKNIRLVVRPCTRPITSDPQLLSRILGNLVSNAIRYTRPNGCILIACRKRGEHLRIEVRDNGVGISRANQANVFREFFQVTQAQLDANKGLGLGLAIVDRLVKLLGHRIELRSAPGEGSVFAVEVPISAGQRESSIQPLFDRELEADESLMDGKRILVVDDDAAVLSGTSGLLRSWGCETSSAASFSQVEQLLRDGAMWDFIISDYQLGGDKDGTDVIALVRQHHNKPIPGILISGDTSQATSRAANAGGHHLLHKPVKPGKLRSLVKHLLMEA